jgi:hypothetical protein
MTNPFREAQTGVPRSHGAHRALWSWLDKLAVEWDGAPVKPPLDPKANNPFKVCLELTRGHGCDRGIRELLTQLSAAFDQHADTRMRRDNRAKYCPNK